MKEVYGRRRRWQYGLLPFLLLLAVGILAMDRGSGVLRRLAYLLDPLYTYAASGSWLSGQTEGEGGRGGAQQGSGYVGAANGEDGSGQGTAGGQTSVSLNGQVQIVYGDGFLEEPVKPKTGIEANLEKIEQLWAGKDYSYLIQNFYIVNSSTYASEELFPVEELLNKDLSVVKDATQPQILIHHTHASEAFSDSRAGVQEDTVVAMGTELAKLLSETYGYQVIHDKTTYDMIDGKLDRNRAYDNAKEGTQKLLSEYPSIQVVIDLHRDSGNKRVTTVNGKETAQIMFFNGLSRNMNGPISYLYNPYLKENLAFSLQLKLKAMEHWADYTKPIFLKGYEYNLSLLPRSLLIEVGTQENTVSEAVNAMEPLAQILAEVLGGAN